MTSARSYVPDEQVLLTELGDGTGVLLHLQTKFYYTLNATGVFVWKALAQESTRSVDEVARKLSEAYRVEAEAAATDVSAVLTSLVAEGLARLETL